MDINFLMFLAVAGAVALQDYVEGAAVLVLFGVAQWLEERSTAAARAAIASVLALKPQTAILADTGESPRCESSLGNRGVPAPAAAAAVVAEESPLAVGSLLMRDPDWHWSLHSNGC